MSRLESLCTFLAIYLVISGFIWFIRLTYADADCEPRYIDYVFPISKLHCKVGGQ
jgi:hypothetical protein